MHSSQTLEFTLTWRQSFDALGTAFYNSVQPTPLSRVHWVARNKKLAAQLGWPEYLWQREDLLSALSGNSVLPGSQPFASVYSGHQFGVWAGQLGDGRALSFGVLQTAIGAQEFQLKGAGLTPYSRMGDGRAVLRSSIREFLCSEAMYGLGIPTTRAFSLCGSPDRVLREEVETAAVVTRVAPSFLRFGHLQHFASNGDTASLQALVDHCIEQHFPHLLAVQTGAPRYTAFLAHVTRLTAELLAKWQAVGFCHGVMNTDNMSLLGLTIDYGPFQFLDGFDPGHICNHSDHQGRYAYARQPQVAYWNLFCLGQAMLPLIHDQDMAVAALETFKTDYPLLADHAFAAKLGLEGSHADDHGLIESLLNTLAVEKTDFTIFWRRLSHATGLLSAQPPAQAFEKVRDLFINHEGWDRWLPAYLLRLQAQDLPQTGERMLKTNPKFVLRNHLGEQAIQQAKIGDFSGVDHLLTVLQAPFDEHPAFEQFAGFPPHWASSISISCSS
ncbi:MAG: YdiU family protein [Limnohabitans sp.]|nr:YdiU family protein [Limnohabitans sp.]